MKVNIDVQFLCTPNLRGIPYYIMNIVNSIVGRKKNEYTISFFDLNHERGNRTYIEKYLYKDVVESVYIKECDKLSFSTVIDSNVTGDASVYNQTSYDEFINTDADVYHFTQSVNIPFNIEKPSIVTVHDLLPILPQTTKYYKDYIAKSFSNCMNYIKENDKITVIADSVSTKNDIIKYVGIEAKRIHVVPLAYNPELHYVDKNPAVLSKYGIDNAYILYLGAIDSRKGIFDILKAYEGIKEKHSNIKLVLAGGINTAEESMIQESVKELNAREDIIFTGFVSDDEKRVLLSSTEVFLFPSEYEGFGLPVLEAMACGAPVITTNVSSLPEVGGGAAMYVTPKQPEELAAAIEKMLSSESVRQDYIARGFEQCKKFSWDKTAAMTEEVYKIAYNK